MRTTIFRSLAVLGMVAFTSSIDPVKGLTAKPDLVIDAFIDAQMHNDAKLIREILDDDAVVNVSRGKTIIKHTKKELLSFYKKIGYVTLNCKASYEILSESENVILSRVDFKFDHFTQQNFLTIQKDKDNNWKVVNINRFNV